MIPRRTNYQRKYSSFKPKPERRDKMSIPYLRDELDAIVRLILPLIESHCFTCSKTRGLQVGHLLERRHMHTRFDTTIDGNNHLQCPTCNARHEGEAEIYRNKYIDRFGVEAYEELEFRSRNKQKLYVADLEQLLEGKEAQLQKLRGKAA